MMTKLPPTPIVLLGTFHFADKGRDIYEPQWVFDVAQRQHEIEDVLERLAAFAPTKIAVEIDTSQQEELGEDYRAFLRDSFTLSENEVHQLGFKLARNLGHERVYALNDWGRFYTALEDSDPARAKDGHPLPAITWNFVETYARKHGQLERLEVEASPFLTCFADEDRKKIEQPLRQTLLELNDPQTITARHGVYLVAHFKVGVGHEYPGVDAATAWYNRNLRIFANLQRITEPGDRLLIIYGAGHSANLRHCLEASPEYELLEVSSLV